MAQFLFEVKQKNRLSQKGLLKRFSITCYGKQETLESIRAKKADKFKELRNKKNSKEYEEWFLRYNPGERKSAENRDQSVVVKEVVQEETNPNKKSKKNQTTKGRSLFNLNRFFSI
jgi:hypothetical protein